MAGDFVKQGDTFEFVPDGGSSVSTCIKECVAYAKKSGLNGTLLNFNGVDVPITQETTVESGLAHWHAQMDTEKYRNSPEGKKAAQAAQTRAEKCQSEVNRLLATLPPWSRG